MQIDDLLGYDCVFVVCNLYFDVVCRVNVVFTAVPVNTLVSKNPTRFLELVVDDRHEVLLELTDGHEV